MKGQNIGYIRVSSYDQNPERQLDGEQLDNVFIDKASGKDSNRPKLIEMLNYVRNGDIVIVHSMDRLARNLADLRTLVNQLNSKGVIVRFIKEGLNFTGEDSPMSNFLLSIMGAFAEFERALIKERQMEGIQTAKKRGVYRGRKKALSEKQITELMNEVNSGANKTKLAKKFNISRETLYKYLK